MGSHSPLFMSPEAVYEFRPYVSDDIPFIHSSWGTSYYEGGNGHKQLSPEEFHSYHRPIRERVLSNPNCTAIVCSNKDDPSHIIGWILVEKSSPYFLKCHFLYVKATFQGNKIARELVKRGLPQRPVLYTHSTMKLRRIIKDNWRAEKNEFERFLFTPHLV